MQFEGSGSGTPTFLPLGNEPLIFPGQCGQQMGCPRGGHSIKTYPCCATCLAPCLPSRPVCQLTQDFQHLQARVWRILTAGLYLVHRGSSTDLRFPHSKTGQIKFWPQRTPSSPWQRLDLILACKVHFSQMSSLISYSHNLALIMVPWSAHFPNQSTSLISPHSHVNANDWQAQGISQLCTAAAKFYPCTSQAPISASIPFFLFLRFQLFIHERD